MDDGVLRSRLGMELDPEALPADSRQAISHASHELRTPLAGMVGLAELLLDTALTPEQRSYAGTLKTSGEALLLLVEELLDHTTGAGSPRPLSIGPFDPAALAGEVVELLAPRAQSRNLELATEIADDVPGSVAGDATVLRQVLTNLIGNAIKFTPAGGALLRVRRLRPGRLRFEVSDTGPGVAHGERALIFRESARGSDAARRDATGKGLGLAIASRQMERMGGRIELSEPGEATGATFAVELDLPELEPPAAASRRELGGESVLVVSPSPIVGPALAGKLRAWGAQTRLAATPEPALTLLAQGGYKAVLADATLGWEALERIVAASRNRAARRIVLIGPHERHALDRLRPLGFETYLVKPVRPASLASRLDGPIAGAWSEEPAAAPFKLPAGHGRLSVLLAEDDDVNALLLSAILARWGHAPTRVADGEAAVQAVREAAAAGTPYDLVLLDLNLPRLDGLAAARRIRALEAGATLPLLGMSADANAAVVAASQAAGIDRFLPKPLDRARLAEALTQAAVGRHAA
ncbi:response regulator [Ancylobacter terrae]|uniref:response regulator n=1 Tax=Ancylobacter sp. sgz301288 TaxID=3342077 RepID=UPI0038585CF6